MPAQVPTVGLHVERAEFGLRLGFKDGLLHLDADGRDDGSAHVIGLELLFEKLPALLHNRLAEGSEVRAALCGVLAIDERKVLFAVTFAMGEGDLDFFARKVDDRV